MPADETLTNPATALPADPAPVSGFAPKPSVPPLPRRSLVGEWLTQPLHLLWISALPQALLLWLNARAYRLVSGEMDATQRTGAAVILAAELALLLGSAGLAIALRVRRQPLALVWNWPLLAATVGYLMWVTAQLGVTAQLPGLVPATVPEWIVSGGELLYYQFVLTMPLAFYAGLRLACFESHRSIGRDFARTIFAGGVLFVLAFLASQTMRWLPDFVHRAPLILFWLLAVAVTLLLLGVLMRSLAISYVGVRSKGPAAMAGLVFVVGIAGPLAGLILNASIPFPVDFQTWEVYALTVLNGLLLMLPNHRHPWIHRLLWLSQCALFPFSLYFFLVFLPVLPLCLPAMFVMGAGLLIVTPSMLFVVHAQRLVDGYRCEVRDGSRWVPAALGILAALLLPAVYVGGALLDRAVLRGALDYAYTPSYRADAKPFPGSPARVGRSLENLRDFKAGLDLPFLTDLYKAIVFNGLFLPDAKMQHLHRVFLGRDLPEANAGRSSIFGHSAQGTRGQPRTREAAPRTQTPPPTRPVLLTELEHAVSAEGPCERARLTLTMENTDAATAEFVTRLRLPEAARVTGFWLHIGPERVPGRLFERKTALWVYHRIRDAVVPRDPGLLLYTGPDTVELRVYPFAAHERRIVEVELLYPTALAPTIQVGERTLAPRHPEAGPEGAVVMTPAGEAGTLVTLTPAALAKLPSFARRPFLHFLWDRSAGSDADPATLRRAMQTAAARFPDAREALLTTVNYECQKPFSAEPMPLPSLLATLEDERALARRLPPLRGGFLQERALKRGLLGARDQLARSGSKDAAALERFPIFVIVRGSQTQPMSDGDEIGGGSSGGLAAFAAQVPDWGEFYVAEEGGRRLGASRFDGDVEASPMPDAAPRQVALLRCGGETVACAIGTGRAETLRFISQGANAADAEPALSVFDPKARAFQPVSHPSGAAAALPMVRVPASAAYARASNVFMRYRALVEDPSSGSAGLTRLAALSRESGVLIGATSYIVVENSAQWRILEPKEKQKLGSAPALEIEQVPEPGAWVMVALGGIIVAAAARRSRRKAPPV
jgi:hypothetical protein